jgi:peptide/nickel transport system substrate-binding protein
MTSRPLNTQRRSLLQAASLSPVAAAWLPTSASAQDRRETLVIANEFGPNMLDIHGLGANRPSYGVAWNCYDRLITYGKKKAPDGNMMYDFAKLEPELATSWKMDADGMGVTFTLRKDAKFHDGTPVTAKDVKWSYDRALGMGGFPTFQMKAGSLEDPNQFRVVNDHTFYVKFIRTDKLSLPDMAVPVASIYNSTLAKKNATEKDPWAAEWLKTNEAGGGAYKVASWKPGQELILERFDDWKSPNSSGSSSGMFPPQAIAERSSSAAIST